MRLSIASYNIHSCVGTDGRKDPVRIASVLDELSCSVVGLQEVESYGPRGGDAHQLDYLARCGGYEGIGGPTMHKPEGNYGNALLTRKRILDVRRHSFRSTGREPRGALEARIEVQGGSVRVIITHLGLRPAERREQVSKVLEIVGKDAGATLLLGDFNEWLPWARSRRRLKRRFGRIPTPPTYPSRRPLFALDHIWVQPLSALEILEPVSTSLSRVASDHLPLRAKVDFSNTIT